MVLDYSKVTKEYDGMITKDQVDLLAQLGYNDNSNINDGLPISVEELHKYLNDNKDYLLKNKVKNPIYNISVKDKVYRIFNKKIYKNEKYSTERRIIVLGRVPNTINVILRGKYSNLCDKKCIRNGNTITIKNAMLKPESQSLFSYKNTKIIIDDSNTLSISKFNFIKPFDRNINVEGKIIQIKKINDNTLNAIITDSYIDIPLIIEDSSADIAEKDIQEGDFISIEFCNPKIIESKLYIIADDNSRILKLKN
jgi:hypothetical protein